MRRLSLETGQGSSRLMEGEGKTLGRRYCSCRPISQFSRGLPFGRWQRRRYHAHEDHVGEVPATPGGDARDAPARGRGTLEGIGPTVPRTRKDLAMRMAESMLGWKT